MGVGGDKLDIDGDDANRKLCQRITAAARLEKKRRFHQ